MVLLNPGTVATLLVAQDVGSEAWWQKISKLGTPLVERRQAESRCDVTFL
ncbi:MAG: hypothetical protein XXXJIFNMEKO3_00760 [Candidatus Erwinia impunctatus]|nr:hypothetical protein XXXJIFNMEKO_00760 [Culicoides impunctatus]